MDAGDCDIPIKVTIPGNELSDLIKPCDSPDIILKP